MTLTEYINKLKKFEKEFGHLTVIYAKDDEGNGYQEIEFPPSIAQVHDLNVRDLELVGYYDEDDEEINKEDCNVIIIN